MPRVVAAAIADNFAIHARTAPAGVLGLFQNKHRGALRDDEAVATSVERSTGPLGSVIAAREGAHVDEAGEDDWQDAGLCAPGDHHIGVVSGNRLERLADGMTACRASAGNRHVRAFGAQRDG